MIIASLDKEAHKNKIKVKIIEVKDGKISLSIKALKENPWTEASKKYKKEVSKTFRGILPLEYMQALPDKTDHGHPERHIIPRKKDELEKRDASRFSDHQKNIRPDIGLG